MSLEKGLAALAIPDNGTDGSFDVGVFLTQLEREAARKQLGPVELAAECLPLRCDEFQRKFLIVFLGQMLEMLLNERERAHREYARLLEESQQEAVEA